MSALADLMAVSGLPGLYKMVGNRPNGLIAEDIDTGKRKFLPMRKHQFSPLETIAIFTYTDSIPLLDLFTKMTQLAAADLPVIPHSSSNEELRTYFRAVLPDHDETRVFPRDIKKIVRWYSFLEERHLLVEDNSVEEEE